MLKRKNGVSSSLLEQGEIDLLRQAEAPKAHTQHELMALVKLWN